MSNQAPTSKGAAAGNTSRMLKLAVEVAAQQAVDKKGNGQECGGDCDSECFGFPAVVD